MSRFLARRRALAGFTLIELLIVIVIIGILVSIGVPAYLKYTAAANDRDAQAALRVAYKAAVAGDSEVNTSKFPVSTTIISDIKGDEPAASVARGSCLNTVPTAPVKQVIVDTSSTASQITLCTRSASGAIWKLSGPLTGNPTVSDGSTVALTVGAFAITDALRGAGVSGDGLASDSSTGTWEATTNLSTNGGFETNSAGWSARGTGSTIVRSTTRAKFGTASLFVSTPGNSAVNINGEGTTENNPLISPILPNTTYTATVWVYIASGTPTLRIYWEEFDSGGSYITSHGTGATESTSTSGQWVRLTTTATSGPSAGKANILVNYDAAAAASSFYVDGAQLEQKSFATPYVETNGSSASRTEGYVQIPPSLINPTQGWMAERVRMDLPSTLEPDLARVWDGRNAGNGNSGDIRWHTGSGTWALAPGGASVVDSWTAGAYRTFISRWTGGGLGSMDFSLNGAPFVTSTGTINTPIAWWSIGNYATGGAALDGDVLWFATGTGPLTNADAATINGFGNTDPSRGQFPASAQATMVWDGTSSTGSLK